MHFMIIIIIVVFQVSLRDIAVAVYALRQWFSIFFISKDHVSKYI